VSTTTASRPLERPVDLPGWEDSAMNDVGASSRRTRVIVWVVLLILIGSSTATAAKMVVGSIPFGVLMTLRFGIAGLCLLPFTWKPLIRLIRDDIGSLLVVAAFCVPINQTFFLNGTRLAPTTHVALIYAACPLVVLALASILGQERPRVGRLIGILASVAGVALVWLDSMLITRSTAHVDLRGDLLLVCAVASWGVYLTLNKPLIARHGALPVLAGTFLAGSLLALPVAIFSFPGWDALTSSSVNAWWGLGYLAVVVSVLGLACQNQALRSLDSSQVAAANNVATMLTVSWGVLLLGEALSASLVVGAALTLGGAVWAGRSAS
jgi:drug/metabolite transporter (DMT)-like permease